MSVARDSTKMYDDNFIENVEKLGFGLGIRH